MTAGPEYRQEEKGGARDGPERGISAEGSWWSRALQRGLRVRLRRGHLVPALGLGFAAWVSTRIGFALLTIFTRILILPAMRGHAAPEHGASQVLTLVSPWDDWDGGWYINVAAHGYTTMASTAFFPLFPLLVRAAAGVLHHLLAGVAPLLSASPWLVASVVASNTSLLVALIALALLVLDETQDRRQAAFILLVVLAYPVAFFLSAGYTESTTLALVSLTLLFARRGWWVPAGVAGGLAALTHATNVVLALVIALEFARQHGWWTRAGWRQVRVPRRLAEVAGGVAATLATPAGLGAYMIYLWHRFGSPLTFVGAEKVVWGRGTVVPWRGFPMVVHAIGGAHGAAWQLLTGMDAGLIVIFVLVIVLAARRLPLSFTLYSGFLVLFAMLEITPVWGDPLVGAGRYLLAAVPVFLGLGVLLQRRLGTQLAMVSFAFLLQGVLVVDWLLGGFVE